MTNRQEYVDIVLPIRGQAPYLGATLASLANQSYQNFRLYIICEDVDKEFLNAQLKTFKGEHSPVILDINSGEGISSALNLGINSGKAKYIARIDADDVMHPKRIQYQAEFLDSHSDIGIVGSQASFIDEKGTRIGRTKLPTSNKYIKNLLIYRNAFVHPSVMMRRNLFLNLKGYDSNFDGAEDYEFWTRASTVTKFFNLSEELVGYRVHANQVTHNNRAERLILESTIQCNYLALFPESEISSSKKRNQLILNAIIVRAFQTNQDKCSFLQRYVSRGELYAFALLHPKMVLESGLNLHRYRKRIAVGKNV